jgi:hypothetical protein
METLRWFVEGVVGLVLDFIAGAGEALVVLNADFDWGLPVELARFIGILLAIFLLLGGLTRLFLWKPRSGQPQSIVLKTTQTPRQVVAEDVRGFVWLSLRVAVVGGLLWLVLRAAG